MPANSYGQPEVPDTGNPYGKPEIKKPSLLRKLGDLGLGLASGAIGATKSVSDAAGAGNAVSGALDTADKFVQSGLSDQAIADQQQQQAILKSSSGQGIVEGVKAAGRAFAVAPVQTAVTGLGSVVPTIAAGLATGGASVPVSLGAMAAMGAAQGAGAVKGGIYDDIKQRSAEAGIDPKTAEATALKAQEYSGPNAGQIALGAGLGMGDSVTGVSKVATSMVRKGLGKEAVQLVAESPRGFAARSALGAAGEVPLEVAQGGQQQYATNVASQQAGFDVQPWDNVVSQGAFEGLASAGPGAAFGALHGGPAAAAPGVTPVIPPEAAPTAAAPSPTPALPYNPGGGTHTVFPDGSVILNSDTPQGEQAVFDKRFAPQPMVKPSEAMGLDANAGSLSAAAVVAVDSDAHQVAISQQNQAQAQAGNSQEATEDVAQLPANINPATGEIASAYDVRQQDAPQAQPGDLMDPQTGAPFVSFVAARRAAKEAGEGYSLFKLGTNAFVARTTGASNGTGTDLSALPSASDGAGRADSGTGVAPGMGSGAADAGAVGAGRAADQSNGDTVPLAAGNEGAVNVQSPSAEAIPAAPTGFPAGTQGTQGTTQAAPAKAPEAARVDAAGPAAAGDKAGNTAVQAAGVAAPTPELAKTGDLHQIANSPAGDIKAITAKLQPALSERPGITPNSTDSQQTNPESTHEPQGTQAQPQQTRQPEAPADAVAGPAGQVKPQNGLKDTGALGSPYQLPEGDIHADWKMSESPDFQPNARQQMVMDATAQALDEGLSYTDAVAARVADLLNVPAELRSQNKSKVDGGDVGYDVYYARDAVEAQRGNQRSREIASDLNLKAGDVIGTIITNDYKQSTGVKIVSVSDSGLIANISGKRGIATITGKMGVDSIKAAIDRAKVKGRRKDGYAEFVAGRTRAAPATAASTSTAPEHQAVGVDNRELSEIAGEFSAAQADMMEGEQAISNVFMPPKKSEVVRLNEKVKVHVNGKGWMTPAEGKAAGEAKPATAPAAQPEMQEAKGKQAKAASVKIADFGEKIGGAKKDLWTSFKDDLNSVKDEDIASQSLTKIWPAPDYQKLIDGGMDGESVGLIRAFRDEIPSKPRQSYKVKRWAEQVKILRELANKLMDGKTTVARVSKEMADGSDKMRGLFGRAELYQQVGHGKSLVGIRLAWHNYSLYKGEKNVSKWVVERDAAATAFSNFPAELATGKTKEEAIEAFKAKYDSLDAEKAVRQASFDIFSERGVDGFFIGKKIGRNVAKIEGPFKTIKEARDYRQNNLSALQDKLEKYKAIPRERADVNQPRVGVDMRNGQDVTQQMFGDTFGFKGVEFGNWVEQKRRQKDLNNAFDALMDMAAVLGIPPKAISLDGKLGLAFGARGSGGVNPAAAHYELDKVVINLTKKEGAGSLGHEWWHALDNYFSRQRKQGDGMMTTALDVSLSSRGANYHLRDGVRKEMVDAFGATVKAINQTTMKARSSKLDAKRTKEYWTTGDEMSARAFESYLISKLQDQNAANDYLANVVDQKTWDAMAALGIQNDNSYPYPTAGEIPGIRAAFDHFFDTVQTKTDESGNVAMFRRSAQTDTPAAKAQATQAVERQVSALTAKWANAPKIIVAFDMQDARIPNAVRVEDLKQRSGGAVGTPEGFYYKGTAYLMSSKLVSLDDTARVLFHEVLGHAGLRGVFGEALTPILQQIATMRKAEVDAKIKEYGLRGVDSLHRLAAAEEVLAEMAQKTPEIGFVKRAIAAIRSWLRANVPGFKSLALSDAEIIRSYILPARGFIERGRQANAAGVPAFARGVAAAQTDTPAFKAWFGTSKVVGPDSSPLTVYHGSTSTFTQFDPAMLGSATGAKSAQGGFFFASNRNVAASYASEGVRSLRDANTALAKAKADIKALTGDNDATAGSKFARGEYDGRQDIAKIEDAFERKMEAENVVETQTDPYTANHEQTDGGQVIEAYLSLKNPLIHDQQDAEFRDRQFADLVEQAKREGRDGLIIKNTIDPGLDGGDFDPETDIYVAFRPDQIKSATGNNGSFDPTNPDIRFSRSVAIGDTLKAMTVTDLQAKAGNKLADYRNLGLQFLGGRQLNDLYAREIPQLPEYTRMVQQMSADANEVGANADSVATSWGKLADERQLAELMHDATLAQIDAAKPYVDGDNRLHWASLNAKFKALTPDAQKVYLDARDGYEEHYANVREAIRDKIERSDLASPAKAAMLERMDGEFFEKIKGVYFPLARFGKYVVVTRNPGGQVVNVSRAETLNEAETLRSAMRKAYPGFAVGKVLKDKEFNAARDAVGRGFLKDLFGVLDAQGVGDELQDAVNQIYLASMPDLSWAKHGIHRKGTPGFSQDARRSYAQNMFHGARYLAKLRYADQLQDKLTGMQSYVEAQAGNEAYDSVKGQQIVDEMTKRNDSLMNPKSNPLSTALTSFGFVFHLGLSPASAMVNLSQTALVAYPIMGAKWGFDKAAAALAMAGKQAASNKNDISSALSPDERRAYDEAVKAGTIDVTNAHDLAGIAQGEDAGVMWKLRPVMKWASFLFHHAERFNRQITFVASYRLARAAGAAHETAFEQATKATYDGHFDYAAANRPRVMQGNAAKVLLLFKQFGQNMIYTLARQAQLAIKAETPEGRKEARKALGGLLVMHASAAGVLGLPLVGALLAAASMLGSSDDEPWDAEAALRNMLADAFGQKPAEVMARGLSRLTPWDVSRRVGLDSMILPDVQEGLQGQRLAETAMAAALGPVAGIGINVLKGLQNIGEGRYALGLEAMMPAALRGPIKALRYGQEGAQDKSGISILDEVSPAALAGQALGFSPSEVRNAQEGKSVIMDHDRVLGARRQQLVMRFARAAMDKDQQGQQEARKEILQFNEKNPSRRILPQHLMASVRGRQKRINQAQDGVYLPRNRQGAMEAGRFAQAAPVP